MKNIVIVLSITLLSLPIFSQNSTEAKKLLDEVATKVESYDNMQLEFSHKLDNDDADVHQETRGSVTLKKDLYHLNYMGTEQLFDGKKTYLIIHEDEEVIIQNSSNTEEETLTPSKMFSFYKSGFAYDMDALKSIKGVKIQYVKLTPLESNSEIIKILVGIDVKTKHIFNIIETGENSTVTTLEVRTFKANQTISDNLFKFDLDKFKNQKNYTISEPK